MCPRLGKNCLFCAQKEFILNSTVDSKKILLGKIFHTKFNKDTSVWNSAGIPPIFNTNNSMGLVRGYQSQQVIGIMAENSDYLPSITYAVFCLASPINALSTFVCKSDIVRMFKMTQPSVVFCDIEAYN